LAIGALTLTVLWKIVAEFEIGTVLLRLGVIFAVLIALLSGIIWWNEKRQYQAISKSIDTSTQALDNTAPFVDCVLGRHHRQRM
jgi:hypothetical protein